MVDAQWGLPVGPFQATTPEYDYWGTAHSLAAEQLEFAIRSMNLLTVFTGDVGSGKSTVVRKVVAEIQYQRLIGLLSYSPTLNVDPSRAILDAFGTELAPKDKEAHRRILQQSLLGARSEHGMPTVIIDDAHCMTDEELSNLFDLAGFNDTDDGTLFKIILVGHSELYDRLNGDRSDLLGPLFALDAMSEDDTADYIRHRLQAAGCGEMPFTDDALNAVYERSRGNPLQINRLCESALDEAGERGPGRIDANLLRDCIVPTDHVADLNRDHLAPNLPVSEPILAKSDLKPEPGFRSKRKVGVSKAKADGSFPSTPVEQSEPADCPAIQPALHSLVNTDLSKPDSASSALKIAKNGRRRSLEFTIASAFATALAIILFTSAPLNVPVQSDQLSMQDTQANVNAPASPSGSLGVSLEAEANSTLKEVKSQAVSLQTNDVDVGVLLERAEVEVVDAPPAPEVALVILDQTAVKKLVAIQDILGALPEEPNERYRRGIAVAGQSPQAAAVAYALAAYDNHARAAYFLGQMYETGEGIPADMVLARSWYERAVGQFENAGERLKLLPPPRADNSLSVPTPLFASVTKKGEVELVWTSGTGNNPFAYTIEFADQFGDVQSQVDRTKTSVLRSAVPDTADYWRVIPLASDGAAGPATVWLPLDIKASGAPVATLVNSPVPSR